MSNHFHPLVKTVEGNLSEFMRHFNIGYTSFFNRRHRRVGNLYQGRYMAFLIDADNYLMGVARSIHLNPVRIKSDRKRIVEEKVAILFNYKRSSLPGYLWRCKREAFVSYAVVLDYLGGDTNFPLHLITHKFPYSAIYHHSLSSVIKSFFSLFIM
jgi:putative transposase